MDRVAPDRLGLAKVVERVWAGINPEQAPSEDEVARIATEELSAVRLERAARRAG